MFSMLTNKKEIEDFLFHYENSHVLNSFFYKNKMCVLKCLIESKIESDLFRRELFITLKGKKNFFSFKFEEIKYISEYLKFSKKNQKYIGMETIVFNDNSLLNFRYFF